jgi:hypothetical protein
LKGACDTLKEELDKEISQKTELENKYSTLDKDFQLLLQRLNDLGVVRIDITYFIPHIKFYYRS